MAWETELDRLLLQQIHSAEKGEVRANRARDQVVGLWELGRGRPASAFHLGYAKVLLGVDLPEPAADDDEARCWFDYGRIRGHDRRGERNWVAELVADPKRLMTLLAEPAIATQCLPIVMRTLFWSGNLEQAVKAIDFLSSTQGDGTDASELVVDAALTDLLARLESQPLARDDDRTLAVLRQCTELPVFARLPMDVRARYRRAMAARLLAVSEFDEALAHLTEARELAVGNERLRSAVCTLGALAVMRVHDVDEVEPRAVRPEEAAMAWLETAVEGGEAAAPEALFVRGIVGYERARYAEAAGWFDHAVRGCRRASGRDASLLDRARFFLAASILASGDRTDASRALRLMEQALDHVRPDLESFYPVHEALKSLSRKVALKFLDAVDIERGTAADQLLFVALEHASLGEAEPAARAAQRVLHMAVDLDQRVEAMRVLLTTENMLGRRDLARETFHALRDLLMQRGAFDELEKVLKNEEFVGQALDHYEQKVELVALCDEMEDREVEKATLQLAMARTLRARKDAEALREAHGILREVEVTFPELAADDLQAIEKLLAMEDAEPTSDDCGSRAAQRAAQALGHARGCSWSAATSASGGTIRASRPWPRPGARRRVAADQLHLAAAHGQRGAGPHRPRHRRRPADAALEPARDHRAGAGGGAQGRGVGAHGALRRLHQPAGGAARRPGAPGHRSGGRRCRQGARGQQGQEGALNRLRGSRSRSSPWAPALPIMFVM